MRDSDHSIDEDRFVLLGMSARLRVLLACHCYRKGEAVIRIISARRATSRGKNLRRGKMKKEYDFSRAKKNPFAKKLKRQITIRIDAPTIDYFKTLAAEMGIPYQQLINLFLRDCAVSRKRPQVKWVA
jgi:predicted DNA binding CopG/RHH family protein